MSSETLKRWRRITRKPQWYAASKLGVSEAIYKNWEQGRTRVPRDIVLEVTAMLNKPPHYGYAHEAFVGLGLHRRFYRNWRSKA